LKTTTRRRVHAPSLFLALAAGAAPALAGEFIWAAPTSGDFLAGMNWNGGAAPGENDAARFDVPGGYTVSLSQDASVANLTINGASPTFDFTTARLDLTLIGEPIASLIVGADSGAPAELIVTSGILTANTVYLGRDAGADGSLSITGASTTFFTDQRVDCGRNGTGRLEIASGTDFTSGIIQVGAEPDAFGRVEITGAATTASLGVLRVGAEGAGELEASGGGQINTDAVTAGFAAGSNGVITLDDVNLDASAGSDVVIGDAGVGGLTLRNTARLVADDLVIGDEAGDGTLTKIGRAHV